MDECECGEGYYGFNASCLFCPSFCYCHGKVLSGCYLSPSLSVFSLLDSVPTACPQVSMNGENACNPQQENWTGGGESFPCEKGYQGRMCGECKSNYYRNNKRCAPCSDNFYWQIPTSYVAVITVLLLYSWHIRPSSTAIFKILLFHFQAVYILFTGSTQWSSITKVFFTGASASSNFSFVAIECLIHWWDILATLVFTLFLPLVFILFATLATSIAFLFEKLTRSRNSQIGYYKLKGLKTAVILMSLGYFNIVVGVVQIMGCTGEETVFDSSDVSHSYSRYYLNAYSK